MKHEISLGKQISLNSRCEGKTKNQRLSFKPNHHSYAANATRNVQPAGIPDDKTLKKEEKIGGSRKRFSINMSTFLVHFSGWLLDIWCNQMFTLVITLPLKVVFSVELGCLNGRLLLLLLIELNQTLFS